MTNRQKYYIFKNREGEAISLRGDMTLEDILSMGYDDFTIPAPGTPLKENTWRAEKIQEPTPLDRCDMKNLSNEISEAWQLLSVLSANLVDDGPTWPRVLEWLSRNEKYKPTP